MGPIKEPDIALGIVRLTSLWRRDCGNRYRTVMNFELTYITALVLGTLHAFEPDHLAAVTSFAVGRPEPRAAMRFGFQWAVGHGAMILVAGALLAFADIRISPLATDALDRIVGFALMLLGAWTVYASRLMHVHQHVHDGHAHVHFHSHVTSSAHEHSHAPTLMGLMHGLAGAAPAVALVPLATFETAGGGLAYLVIFAIGTVVSMTMFALFAGTLASRARLVTASAGRVISRATGLATIVIGFIWLVR